ncbi:MAG TPA: molybdate ABC transporter permease subunit [Pirellulales bacterium]|nr:molybdate ABC transporter permease subunit [Pirellulales bacterium]
MDWTAAWLSFELASVTTLALAVLGLPLGAWLARTRSPARFLVEAGVALPLLLPPTVLGFYLLRFASPTSWLGHAYEQATGSLLPFSFTGILLASILCNLPFAVRPFSAALAAVDQSLVEASWCLGVSRWTTFWRIVVPLAWPGIATGLILTFAHTIGEFGVVLMVGGNIPGVSRTLAISIYDDVQALDYDRANSTALALLVFSFVVLGVTSTLNQGKVRMP